MVIDKDMLIVSASTPVTVMALWSGSPVALAVVATAIQLGLLAVVYRQGARRRRAEERLRRALVEAECANRAKSAFLANMSHELRTPLNAIIGFAEALDGRYFGALSDKQADYIRHIQTSGRHLLGLISDLLDMSRIEAGRIRLCEGDLDVAKLLDTCCQRLADAARAGNVAMTCHCNAALPRVRGDRARLERGVLALLANAVKFTPPGGQVSLTAAIRPGGGIALVLKDTGIGMTEEELALALTPFHQIDGPLAKRFAGAGVGLSLAWSLVALHGGRLDVTSRKHEGTTVTITLPPERVLWRQAA